MISKALNQIQVLDLNQLKEPTCCVVQLATQPRGVIHQVILRPDKVKGQLIRLGETKGDEAAGWQHPDNIQIIEILGIATIHPDGTVEVNP